MTMARVETFPNAPIVEAILSIEVDYIDDLVTPAETFHRKTRDLLPIREEIASSGTADRDSHGYRFTSKDRLQVVQITPRSFSFHRLRPYSNWEQFSGAALGLWNQYLSEFMPDGVRGVNLRYLNRIDIPAPFSDLREYVSLSPNLPEGVDAGFFGYLLRLSLRDASVPAVAYVTQRTEYDQINTVLPLLFDIDVRSVGKMSARDEVVWRMIEKLRDYKNRLFFSSITEAARKLFR
jgi:uncharacterized protein (TIGR04255 family)